MLIFNIKLKKMKIIYAVVVVCVLLLNYEIVPQESTTTTTTGSNPTSTTSGQPVPAINTTPSTQPPPPPPPNVEQPQQEGMHRADEEILKWLLANDPNKPLGRIGIHTKAVKALLNNPRIKEAVEALRHKLENLDSQDPSDPEVQKVVKEFRTLLKKAIAKAKLKSIKKRGLPQIAKSITPGLPPDKPLPLPAKPIITNPHRVTITQPPPPTPSVEIPPQETSSTTSSSTTTTTSQPPGPPQPDPLVQQLIQLIMQLIQKQLQGQNIPQEIKDLQTVLQSATSKTGCIDGIKNKGGTDTLNAINTLLGKQQWTDADKQEAKNLKERFCIFANQVTECQGVCSGEGTSPSEDPFKDCRVGTSSCTCTNEHAKKICKAYTPNYFSGCESTITDKQYLDAVWFHRLLDSIKSLSQDEQNKRLEEAFDNFTKAVCTTDCKGRITILATEICP